SEWPTATLELVSASFNAAVSQVTVDAQSNRFYRQRVRGLYLLLSLCLLSTSLVIRLTLRAVAIISASFTTAYLGLDAMLTPFLADLSSEAQLPIAAFVYLSLAVLFPVIVRWDPRELFKKRRRTF